MKAEPTKQETTKNEKVKKFRAISYYLDWIGLFVAIGSILYKELQDKELPDKSDYYK